MVRGIQTGVPAHEALQADVKRIATDEFPDTFRSEAMLAVFDNAAIDARHFARPLEWYAQPRTFAEKNAVYVEEALALSERLATQALDDAGITPQDVDAIVFVSSTGVSTPSLDAYLMQRMGISPGAARLPLWGLGCAGGAAGLARASDMVRAGYRNVLLIAVEFCSLTFVLGDDSKSNFIGTALFGDGGAALVLGPETDADAGLMRIEHTHSALLNDTAPLTGWDVVEDGFKLRLSKDIPAMVLRALRPAVDASLATGGWTLDGVDTIAVHPGGTKVIEAYQAVLGLDTAMLDTSRETLREHGNMSSPTVLFALERALRSSPRGRGLISATGPGFSVEHLLVKFP